MHVETSSSIVEDDSTIFTGEQAAGKQRQQKLFAFTNALLHCTCLLLKIYIVLQMLQYANVVLELRLANFLLDMLPFCHHSSSRALGQLEELSFPSMEEKPFVQDLVPSICQLTMCSSRLNGVVRPRKEKSSLPQFATVLTLVKESSVAL